MSSGIPCPNPACSHVFAYGEIKGAGALTCPRCRHVFQLSAAAPAPPLAKPAAAVRSSTPAPLPRALPAVSLNKPAAPTAVRSDAILDVPLGRASLPYTPRSSKRAIVITCVALAIALAIVGPLAYFAVNHWATRPDEATQAAGSTQLFEGKLWNLSQKSELAFRLALPRGVWKPHATLKQGLGAAVALQRGDPDVWLAVAVRDYGTHQPRDAELMTEALDRLAGHFGDHVAYGAKSDWTQLAGQKAQRLEFKGTHNSVVWRGECHTFTHHGLGYWVFCGASDLATAQSELAAWNQGDGVGLRIASARKGWTAQPPEMDQFRAADFGFAVKAPKGVWLGGYDAREVDDRGVLYLIGRDLKEKDPTLKNRKNAFILVTTQDKTADLASAMKKARADLDAKFREENYKVGPVDEKTPDLGVTCKFGGQECRLADLCVTAGLEPKRFVLLCVLPLAERTYAFRCDCVWEYRQAWRSDFEALLETLRVLNT